MEIRHLGPADRDLLVAAGHLFDTPPTEDLAGTFLDHDGHHCLIAFVDDTPAGFVTGVEIHHPDKPPEMLLYELGVDDRFRRKGVGTALVRALRDIAHDRSHRGMWVLTEPDNDPAIRTYRAVGGADEPEVAALFEWTL